MNISICRDCSMVLDYEGPVDAWLWRYSRGFTVRIRSTLILVSLGGERRNPRLPR